MHIAITSDWSHTLKHDGQVKTKQKIIEYIVSSAVGFLGY